MESKAMTEGKALIHDMAMMLKRGGFVIRDAQDCNDLIKRANEYLDRIRSSPCKTTVTEVRPENGCICPPTSELTCQRWDCGRKAFGLPQPNASVTP